MDPLTWVYLALLAAGTAAQDQAVRKVDKETTKAQIENRNIRQKREQDSEALAQSSKDAFLQTKDKQAQRAQQIASELQAAPQNLPPQAGVPGGVSLDPQAPATSTTVADNAGRIAANNRAYANTRAKSIGQMDAYGDVMTEAGQTASRNASDIARNAKSMQDWTNFVLPMKLAAAGQSGRNWSTTGDILKLAAAVTGAYALSTPAQGAQQGVGESIQASKGPAWLPKGAEFGVGPAGDIAAGGGSVPIGSSFGLDALASTGAGAGFAGAGEEASKALWKQIHGYALSQRERQLLLQQTLSRQ